MTDPLPPGWAKTSLGEVCNIRSGNSTLIKGRMFSEPGPDRVPAFSASGQDIWCEEAEHHGPGIVISAVGARCGKAFLASGAWTAIANTQVARSYGDIDIRFLWYLLNNEDFWVKGGSAQPFVKVKPSLELAMLLPPLAEQERIVAAIEEHFSRIDATESAAQTALARLDILRRAILTAAFSGHLVDQDPDNEPASILLERIAAERPQRQTRYAAHGANQGPYSVSKKLPPGWKWATVGELSTFVRGVTFKKSDAFSELSSGLVPIARAGNVESGRSKLDQDLVYVPKERVAIDQYLRTGDILIATSSGSPKVVGKSAIIPEDWQGAHGAFMGVIRSNPDICSAYLGFYVQSECVRLIWRELAAGTNINNLKRDDIIATTVPLPPVAEQKRIVAAIEVCFTRIDTVKASLERCLQRCGVLRQTVLAAAFSGRLVKQDPSNEPASVLLERIAAEQPKRRTRRKSA